MASTQSRRPSSFAFLTEGLLLPARNRCMFAKIFVLTVASSIFARHSCDHAYHGGLWPHPTLMEAAFHVASYVSPAVWAVTATAAAATYSGRHRHRHGTSASFLGLLRDTLRGGVKAGPVATAIYCNLLWVVSWVGGAAVLHFLVEPLIIVRRRRSLTLLSIDLFVAMHVVHHLLMLYLAGVFSVAVVVSASASTVEVPTSTCRQVDPAGALRRAWRLTAPEKAALASVVMASEGGASAAISRWSALASRSPYPGHFYMACRVVVWFAFPLLSGAARMLSVCVATAYYHERRQSVDGASVPAARPAAAPLPARSSVGYMLVTFSIKIRRWSMRRLAFVSRHSFVLWAIVLVMASILAQGIPSIFFQDNLVLYRFDLRIRYHYRDQWASNWRSSLLM